MAVCQRGGRRTAHSSQLTTLLKSCRKQNRKNRGAISVLARDCELVQSKLRISHQSSALFRVQRAERESERATSSAGRETMAHLQGMEAGDKQRRVLRLAHEEGQTRTAVDLVYASSLRRVLSRPPATSYRNLRLFVLPRHAAGAKAGGLAGLLSTAGVAAATRFSPRYGAFSLFLPRRQDDVCHPVHGFPSSGPTFRLF